MGTVELRCDEASATLTITFADFGAVDVAAGCGKYTPGNCSEEAFARGWSHQCAGKHDCVLDPNDLQPPHHPDPCIAVPKIFAVAATCSSGGGHATVSQPSLLKLGRFIVPRLQS